MSTHTVHAWHFKALDKVTSCEEKKLGNSKSLFFSICEDRSWEFIANCQYFVTWECTHSVLHRPHTELCDCLSWLFKDPSAFAWQGHFIIFRQDGRPLCRPVILCPNLLLRRGVLLQQHFHQRLGTGHWWNNYNFRCRWYNGAWC